MHSFAVPFRDVRDPHFLVFKGKLFVYTGTWYSGPKTLDRSDYDLNKHLGYAVWTEDGRQWHGPTMLEGTFGHYIWRAAAHGDTAYLCGRRKPQFEVAASGAVGALAHDAGEQRLLNAQVFDLAATMNLPVIATNDAHFLKAEDHDAHDVLLCIGLKKDRLDDNRMHYDRGLYFKSAPEIREHFGTRPDVLENTLKIADEAGFTFDKTYYVPSFPLPEGVKTEN